MVLKRILWLALLIVYPACANTIIVTGVDSALGWQQSLYINENGSNNQLYWSGAIDISIDGWARQVFCVDLFTDIGLSTYNATLDFSDTPSLKRVGWLLENQFPVTQLAGAAFQLAIWDIVHDGGDGFAVGAGKVSQSTDAAHPTDAGVLAAAAQYEAVSVGQSSTLGIVYKNVTLSSGAPVQNLMGRQATDGGPFPKTPEPAALLMIVSGLALIGLGRLRRGRR